MHLETAAVGKRTVIATGFLYGLVLAIYASAWGVTAPTLTMPFAASPLNLPFAVLSGRIRFLHFILPMLIVIPIALAPFLWSGVAILALYGQSFRTRLLVVSVLFAHYLGIAWWFYLAGEHQISWAIHVLRAEAPFLILFYLAGQELLWWALLKDRKPRNLI